MRGVIEVRLAPDAGQSAGIVKIMQPGGRAGVGEIHQGAPINHDGAHRSGWGVGGARQIVNPAVTQIIRRRIRLDAFERQVSGERSGHIDLAIAHDGFGVERVLVVERHAAAEDKPIAAADKHGELVADFIDTRRDARARIGPAIVLRQEGRGRADNGLRPQRGGNAEQGGGQDGSAERQSDNSHGWKINRARPMTIPKAVSGLISNGRPDKNRAMNTGDSTVTLQVGDNTNMQAYVARPSGPGPFPGLIVFPEAFGVNHHMRAVADRFAAEGYLAISPELYHRTAPAGYSCPYADFATVPEASERGDRSRPRTRRPRGVGLAARSSRNCARARWPASAIAWAGARLFSRTAFGPFRRRFRITAAASRRDCSSAHPHKTRRCCFLGRVGHAYPARACRPGRAGAARGGQAARQRRDLLCRPRVLLR